MTTSIRPALALGLVCSMACAVAAEQATPPVWPAGATDKKDPKVLAFYDGQCQYWADRQGLGGDARVAYLTTCRANASKVYAVGYGPPAVGGGE